MTGQRPSASRRAAIYARFSTELQRDQSIEDQLVLCRTAAHRDGLSVVATYEDRARSGASLLGRPGLEKLLAAAETRAFDVVVVEALDRLSRDMADLAGVHRRLTFLGIEIRAVHDGVADTVTVGLRGLVGQLFREDGVKKIRRGMAGVIREGRYAGGRSYGYRPTPGEPGRPQIVEEEAAIVRRIFAEYADGRSPRDIAGELNREGVAPPRGAAWNASTINGNGERGNGIIQNPLYSGEIIWNRVRMVKDPSTGKRISRPNPAADWQRAAAAHLAIVDPDTWERARARKRASLAQGPEPRGPRRYQRSLLSGLLRCGACGSGMAKHDNANGRPRIRCSRATESGSCTNRRSYYLGPVEAGVVESLRAQLDQPQLIAEFVKTYHEERRRLAGADRNARAKSERRLAEIDGQISRMVEAIAQGGAAFAQLRLKLEDLDRERRDLAASLAAAAAPANVVALHPHAVASFQKMLEALAAELDAGASPIEHAAFRQLVETIIVHPAARGEEPRVEIVGKLAAILDLSGLGAPAADRNGTNGGFLVAEEGLEPPTQGL
ncbi:recombinase family protein [Methylosinus sp. Sm6]|nr:recombinase family protein [Methylosinus sp. Sm6]MBY6242805.1 recombinase family protein [Methylosinus sp. Sm6]